MIPLYDTSKIVQFVNPECNGGCQGLGVGGKLGVVNQWA